MGVVHVFADISGLQTQTVDEKYGPVDGNEETEFRLTTLFHLNQSRVNAYAVTNGVAFVQPQWDSVNNQFSSLKANLVLRPNHNQWAGFAPVEYFIYRGLSLDNFVDSNEELISPGDSTSTELIQKIWDDYDNPTIEDIGYNHKSLPDSEPLTNIFFQENNQSQLATVTKGMQIGKYLDSSEPVGFEVVLKEGFYFPDLEMVRKPSFHISVSQPASGDIPGNEPLEKMREREKVLNFVDPTTFFMLFHLLEVDHSGGTWDNANQIYNNLGAKSKTSDTLYIDIRNDTGYSLNYFKDNEGLSPYSDYGKHIQSAINASSTQSQIYYTNYWPIYIQDQVQAQTGQNPKDNPNKLHLRIRKDYNPHPLIYKDFAWQTKDFSKIEHDGQKFNEEPDPDATTKWSDPAFTYFLPFTISGTSKIHTWYVKLYCIRYGFFTPSNLPATVIPRQNPLDNLWPAEFNTFFTNSQLNSVWHVSLGKRFVYAHQNLGISGMAEVSVGTSQNNITFKAKIIDYYLNLAWNNELDQDLKSEPAPSSKSSFSTKEPIAVDNTENDSSALKKKTIKDASQNPISVFALRETEVGALFNGTFALTLTKAQYVNEIEPNIATFLNYEHPAFINVRSIEIKEDGVTSHPYFKMLLRLGGLDNNGYFEEVNVNNVVLHSTDLARFSTDNAANNVTLTQVNDKIVTPSELIQYSKVVENFYQNSTTYYPNRSFSFNDSNQELLTRIRSHFYGYLSHGRWKGYAFDLAAPKANYIEEDPYSSVKANCNSNTVPVGETTALSVGCRRRRVYEKYNGTYKEFLGTKGINNARKFLIENSEAGSAPILNSNGEYLDFGHALYGLDVALNSNDTDINNNQRSEEIFYAPHEDLQAFNLMFAIDFTSFIGDLAKALATAYNEFDDSPSQSQIDKKIQVEAPTEDLIGDAELFGYVRAWKFFNDTLSTVLDNYYASSPTGSHDIHYTNRWKIFCEDNELIYYNSNNNPVWDTSQTSNHSLNGNSVYDFLKRRLEDFSIFIYSTRGKGRRQFGFSLFTYPSSYILENPNFGSDLNYVLDQFLSFTKSRLNDEQGWNL